MNDWDAANPAEGAGMVAAAGRQAVRTFFERITKDIEIVRVALLLTGCIQVSYLLFVIGSYFVSVEILLEKKRYITYLFGSAIILTMLLMLNHKSIIQIIINEIAVFSVLSICLAIDFYKKEDLMKDHKTNCKDG